MHRCPKGRAVGGPQLVPRQTTARHTTSVKTNVRYNNQVLTATWNLTTQVKLGNIVMWVTKDNNAEQDYFKILILQETWKTQNQHQVDICVFLEVKHLYQ